MKNKQKQQKNQNSGILQGLILVLMLVFVVINIILLYFHFSQKPKYVYVDSAKLLNNYRGMKSARLAYQKKLNAWQHNIDTLQAEIDRENKAYKAEFSQMTEKEKDLSQALIQTKREQLARYQAAIREKAQEEDRKMTRAVLTEVNSFLRDYGKEKGYQIIWAATNVGNIAYAAEGLDITDQVLEKLNAL